MQNAAKFTDKGSIVLDYELNRNEREIIYRITDTGKGIPADKQEYVFERFTKLDDFTQGTGLGLPICRLIAEKLGGTLVIDKEYTVGCRFILTLPLIEVYIFSPSFVLRCTMRAPAGTFSVTHIFPPTVAPLPMVTRPKMVALE